MKLAKKILNRREGFQVQPLFGVESSQERRKIRNANSERKRMWRWNQQAKGLYQK